MERELLKLVVDDITMMDMLVFEKAVGTKLFDALSPRLIKDTDTGQPIMVPDPDNPEGPHRPLKAVNMSTQELLGVVMIAKRQANRDTEKQYEKIDSVGRLRLSEIMVDIDWGTVEEDGGNPTSPEAASTESS